MNTSSSDPTSRFVCVVSLDDIRFVRHEDRLHAVLSTGESIGTSTLSTSPPDDANEPAPTSVSPMMRRVAFHALDDALKSPGVLRPLPDGSFAVVKVALLNPFTSRVAIGPVGSSQIWSWPDTLAVEPGGNLVDVTAENSPLAPVTPDRAELMANLARLSSV